MTQVHPDAMIADRRTAPASARRPWMRAARMWLIGIAGALAVAVCSIAFLLWGVYGPAFLLDLIAAYCG